MTLHPDTIAAVVLLILAILLAIAVWGDVQSHRIPNRLVLSGLLLGLTCNGLLPLWAQPPHGQIGTLGWADALLGMAAGLAVLLPMYLLRALGAGDVKLLAMVGAFLGPQAVLGAALGTLVAGGVLALAAALRWRVVGAMLSNVSAMVQSGVVQLSAGETPRVVQPLASAGQLPYAIAIAAGTAGYLVWVNLLAN